jgi:hypothetical protein
MSSRMRFRFKLSYVVEYYFEYFVIIRFCKKIAREPLPGCQTFDLNQCSGDNIETNSSFEASRWWTPRQGLLELCFFLFQLVYLL